MCLNKCKGCKKKLSEQPLLNHMERQLASAVEELQIRIEVIENISKSRRAEISLLTDFNNYLQERVTVLEANQASRLKNNKELNKQ